MQEGQNRFGSEAGSLNQASDEAAPAAINVITTRMTAVLHGSALGQKTDIALALRRAGAALCLVFPVRIVL
jgi:hypothetical protein